jgi:hypothetical protein
MLSETLEKPLTELMIITLMDCYERELMDFEPYDAVLTPSARALVSRGMLGIKNHITENGKMIFVVYVTKMGRQYLNKL